ncbi:basic membrane protein A [Clostridium tetanomorphum]|uniref:BMP family ABC transporter substrate-binding protein n=1 Tax=Clostridium tetanomorphum TaxID=1553 RepID=A0A923EBI5_CLOTT|nr:MULTISPECIES: BMP family ABC transporter substrate-binding protein [Clostridium]KAJ50401.1 membrane lipoprotein tmpC precursor [Clostridium tetanomorphum DSM 665]MBC2398704.1 BMP family ABC transporter substrate-binding protein [Clostridium tetanomorphum]MBC2425505.1 BMP family ABC transporter substrate-binding protein [Clostridium beijerinckii]MBP1865785.1 basic membrane protein A [Clostridium tetanomorphum]NRS86906.1 basic membrane protein A [Clostridium tetanomorphum]
MNKKRVLSLLAATVMSVSLFAGCGGAEKKPEGGKEPEKQEQKLKVGLVTDQGGVNDGSFNQSAHKGIEKAVEDLGIEQINAIESKQQEQYEPNLKTMAGAADLVVGCGFMMEQAMQNVSSQISNKKFLIVDAEVKTGNTLSITFKEEEGSFLAGVIAGKMTKTNKVGFIGGKEGPVINRFECGFAAGVMSVNPEAGKLLMPIDEKTPGKNVKYIDSFDDQQKGIEGAKMLYNSGCDIVFHAAGGAGLGLFKAAKEMNKWAIGVDSDQAADPKLKDYKNVILISMEKKVGASVIDTIKSIQDGSFKGGEHKVLGIKEDRVGIAPTINQKVTKESLELSDKYKEAIKADKFKVPGTRKELLKFKAPQI